MVLVRHQQKGENGKSAIFGVDTHAAIAAPAEGLK